MQEYKQYKYPKITIVTPNYNQGKFLEKCIQSVINQNYPNLEYFVIDGKSTDNSIAIIKKFENKIAYWISEEDKGQSDAINKGLAKTTGEIFNWLNSDDYLEPNALFKVAEAFFQDPAASAWVGGCRRVDENERILNVVFPNSIEYENFGQNYNGRQFYQPGCFYNTGLVREVGGINTKQHFAMDFDLYLRLLRTGHFAIGNGIWANALIHAGAKTQHSRDKMVAEIIEIQKKNGFHKGAENVFMRTYRQKPREIFFPDEKISRLMNIRKTNQIEVRNNSSKREIVFISNHLPWIDKGSSDVRNHHILKILLANNFKIRFMYSTTSGKDSLYKKHYQGDIEFVHLDLSSEIYAREILSVDPDVIWITNLWSLPYFETMLGVVGNIAEKSSGNIFIDTMDYHFKKFKRKYEYSNLSEDLETAEKFFQLEKAIYPLAQGIIVVTDEEKKDIRRDHPQSAPIHTIPNIHNLYEPQLFYEKSQNICFLGNFSVNHNADSVRHFLKNIFPTVKELNRGIEFHIIGNGSKAYVHEFSGPNIKILGSVENLEKVIHHYRLFVCPMTYGAGMKGKIGLAASMGLPFVTTSIGAEGFPLKDGEECFVADDPVEFAQKCSHLIQDSVTWYNFSLKSKLMVADYFSQAVVSKNLLNLLCTEYVKKCKTVQNKVDNSGCDYKKISQKRQLEKFLAEKGWEDKLGIYLPVLENFQSLKKINNPALSLIVISNQFKEDTIKCFEILCEQRSKNYELIFVNNGADDHTFEPLKRFIDTYVKLSFDTGAYLSRNVGAIFANAPILAFLDDDAIPDHHFIDAHLNAHDQYEVIAVRGVCLPKTDSQLNSLAGHYYLGQRPFPIYADLEGNTSYSAKVFFAVGGWDDEIAFGGGGVDMSRRLLDKEPDQRKQIYSPKPIIYHDYAISNDHLENKRKRQKKSWERLRAKHTDYDTFLASWSQFKGRDDLLIKRNSFQDNVVQPFEESISILIPTYNREQYLTRTIESALSQDYDNLEVLVIDDGSTDSTEHILEKISSDKFKYICKDHTGAPDTRNRAVREARGKYILWLDSDDMLMPDTISNYERAISKYPDVDVFYGDLKIIDPSGNFKQELKYPDYYNQNEALLSRLLIANAIPNPGTLIKKSVYQKHGEYSLDFKRAHDYELWARIANQVKFKHIGAFVCKWRWHDTNMSSGSVQFDTSYDIQIKKNILESHPLQDLFPHLNWQEETQSLETAYFTIANAFNKLKGYKEAANYYEKCQTITKRENYYCALGLTYFQLKDLQKSIWAFDEALKINPLNEDAKEISANLNKIHKASKNGSQTSLPESCSDEDSENIAVNRSTIEPSESVTSDSFEGAGVKLMDRKKIAFYALRELHLPVLLPVYRELSEMAVGEVGFMAPPYRESDDVAFQEGLSNETIKCLEDEGIPFWGHEPEEKFDCVIIADVCYDRVDGWGPIVCIGHGTISKGLFFTNNPVCRRENFATVLCVPGPWYKESFGNQVITHIEPTGFSKMDELAPNPFYEVDQLLENMGFNRQKKIILFAPTFNPELTAMGILKDEWKKLDPEKYQVIFKLHGAAHKNTRDEYKTLASTQPNFYYVEEPGIAPYMHACDFLVSDVSSVYVEFFALGKPIILVNNPDMHKYPWYDHQNIEYQVREAAYQIGRAAEIHEILEKLDHSDPLSQSRIEYSNKLFPPLDGQNSNRIAQQIVKVARGEIQLNSASVQNINVYLPLSNKNLKQIEENLNRASFPVNVFTHGSNITQIGTFPVSRLGEDQLPPTPLICMTGEHVFPHQWDYLWSLTEHFNRTTGVFGSYVKDKVDDCYLQQGPVSADVAEMIQKKLQGHHKVHKSTYEQYQQTQSLRADGLIVTNGIDKAFIRSLLQKVRNPAEKEIPSEDIKAAGYHTGVLEGLYCYTSAEGFADDEKKIAELSTQLKNQPGNKAVTAELKNLLLSPRTVLPLSQCSKMVSVIIPYYQQQDTIEETLISVCNQTYQDFEIIFVNDGSEDEGTVLKILQSVAQQYPEVKIKYHYKENTGLADTRNFGIRQAVGEYILPLDSDDLIASNFLEKTVSVLNQNPSVSFVYTEVLFWGEKNEIWGTIDFDPKVLLSHNLMTCTTLFRKKMWERVGGYDLNMKFGYEDWNFWISAVEKGFVGTNVHQPLFLYRRKKNSMLENRVYYDPLAKEQIVRNHIALYKELTPETVNLLRQSIGIIPPQLIRSSQPKAPESRGEQIVLPAIQKEKPRFKPQKQRKLLFVCHDFPPYKYAGAQLYAYNLAAELISKGYDVRIFHPVDVSSRNSNESKILYEITESTYKGLPVYQINIDEKNNPGNFWNFNNPLIEKKFKELLLKENFNLVHFHLLYRLSSSLPLITKDLGIPSVCTLHDYWLLCPLGHMVDSKMRACSGPESAAKCTHCVSAFNRSPEAEMVDYFKNRLQQNREAYEHIDYKISPSNFLAETHAQYGYSKPHVLPLGWLPVICTNNRKVDKTVVFGYCGQIISRKGLDILVNAFGRMNHNNWKLKIYGEGYDPAYLNVILEQIKNNDQIEYNGKFTTEDLPRIYSGIDVAVIPSRRENYPLTLLEALSAKVPVVASDVGGVREIITDKVQGFIYSKDDAGSLRDILSNITRNPQIIRELKSNIQPIKTIKNNAAEMDQIYQRLVDDVKGAESELHVQDTSNFQAVVLAAGRGSRLGSTNGDIPKCMAAVGQETIIERQIRALQAVGVEDIYVVVGYQQEMVKKFINEKFENIKFIENDIYATTNTIYSLYLAIPFLNQDFFYLNGDVLFRKELLEKLMSETGSGMAVEMKRCGDEEVKVKLDGQRITSISKKVPIDESIGEFIGVGFFRKDVHGAFFRNLKHEVEENKIINDYFERALDKAAKEIELISVDITGEPVIEIDFPEDLENAKLLANEIDAGANTNEKSFKKVSKESMEKLTSIIILTRNQIHYTQKCIDSIFKHTHRPFELILVDNGSSDGTVEYLESEVFAKNTACRIKIIKNDVNQGFAAGNNQGMAEAKGDYILLMNNDIAVTPFWIDRLIACAEQRPEIGIVGPRSNCVSGSQMIEEIAYDAQTLQGLDVFSDGFALQYASQARQVLRVVGFCMLIKRAVINKIGGMDDRYGLGNFEDDDFSLRAAIAGFESWIALDCFIHHYGSRTFVGENIDYRKSLFKNWEIFKTKWELPQDLPYGSPYQLSQMKNTTFAPETHTYPLKTEDHLNSKDRDGSLAAEEKYREIQEKLKTMGIEAAIAEFEDMVALYPEFALAYNDLGVLHYQHGNKDDALRNYETAVRLDSANTTSQKNLADFYYVELGRIEDALQIYVKILEDEPKDVETLLITGHICVSLHQFEDARVFYKRVLEIEPLNEVAQENLAKLNQMGSMQPELQIAEDLYQEIQPLLNNGDPHKAIASLTELLERFPDFALAHNDLGVLFYHTGDKEKAQHHYEYAVKLAPDNINFKKNLADFCCIELGRIEDALHIYVSILKTDPQDVETLMATGQICKALEKPDDARDFFNQILQIEPWHTGARKQIEEMEIPPSGIQLNAASVEDAYRRFQEKLNTLTPAEAIDELEKLIESYPDFTVGHNDLAVLCYNAGDKDKALHHYQRAADLQPENITLQKNLADFLFVEQGRVEEALQIYVNLLATHPVDVETLMITGHICVALKKFDDARDFYQRVLALEPGNEDASQNLNAINNRQNQPSSAGLDASGDITASSTKVESTDLKPEASQNHEAASNAGVSIVLSLDGIQNRVKECLKSIQLHTTEPHELLLIDCGATKGMLKWARQLAKDHDNYRIIACARQDGWPESINQAIQKASGDLIVLIHNDVVLPDGWLNPFMMCLNHEPDTGVVGPLSNRAVGIQQIMRSDESGRADFESEAEAFYEQNLYRRVTTQKLSDFCLVFRHALIEKIGNFDAQFVSEKVAVEDFCNRAAAAGFHNLIAADTYVYHYDRHKVKNNASQKNSAGDEDRKKYGEKWDDPQNPTAKDFQMVELLTRADESSQKGQIDQAVETLLVAIGARPEEKQYYYALAEVSLAAKRFQNAKEALNEIPSANENPDPQKLKLLGYAEEGLANYEAAQACAEQLLAINSQHAPALNLKGLLAYHNTDCQSAEQYFKQALNVDPGYGEPYTNLGMLQLEAEQHEDALKSFEKGFRLTPTDLDIATNYHTLVAGIGGYANAESVAREAAVLYPNNQKIKYMLIDFLVQQGKYEMAMPEIEAAIIKFGIDDGILAAALKVREKLGPMTIQTSVRKVPVSVCMIIKDEEKYLARSLASVKPIADEIILVDTGSSDRSKDIATTFGAQVYNYDWENDFAAARNFSISKASGEWILILDGDEVISSLDYDRFNKIVVKKPKAPVAYTITTRNYNRLANIVGWMPNCGEYPDEEATIGWLPSDKVRLFYGKEQIWFEGAVHELVDPVLKRNGIEIEKCSIPVHHYGRLDKVKLDRKGEIYFEIGQKKLSEMGEDVNALRELAIQATILERNEEALDLWQRLLTVNPFPELTAIAFVNMGTIYSRLAKFEEALEVAKKAVAADPDLKEAQYNCAMAELHCGNAPAAINALENLLLKFPDYPPARFILSAAYFCVDQKERGLEGIRNLKKTPVGVHLTIPCLELGQSLVAAKQIQYALQVLGAAIECNIVNKEILDLFTACMQMNPAAQDLSDIQPIMPIEQQPSKFENLPQ